MFTVELKINGTLIAHIYGVNFNSDGEFSDYEYDYYEVKDRKVKKGIIRHKRENGLAILVKEILANVTDNKE